MALPRFETIGFRAAVHKPMGEVTDVTSISSIQSMVLFHICYVNFQTIYTTIHTLLSLQECLCSAQSVMFQHLGWKLEVCLNTFVLPELSSEYETFFLTVEAAYIDETL